MHDEGSYFIFVWFYVILFKKKAITCLVLYTTESDIQVCYLKRQKVYISFCILPNLVYLYIYKLGNICS
jgi:hypothetical protein